MTRHVSTESLARFRAGDLSTSRSRRVKAHLDGCARCRAASAALAEIPALLAAVDVPQMPAHLAARIETALATEAAHRAAGAPSMRARPGHARRAAPRRWWGLPAPALRIAAAAAAVVVVGGGGYEIVSNLGGSLSSGAARSSAGGSTAHSAGRSAGAAGQAAPRAFGPEGGPPLRYRHAGHTASITPVRTSTNYQPAQLAQQAAATLAQTRRELRSSQNVRAGATPSATPSIVGGPYSGRLAGCVSRVAAGRTVLLVDLARFRGAPATIIVTAARGAAAGEVWVVAAGCSGSASDVLAHRPLPGH